MAATAALALTLPAPAGAAYDGVVGCADHRVRNAQIVAFSPEARVFRKRAAGVPAGSVAYACMKRSGPITRLKGSTFGAKQMKPLLAGRYVAFQRMFAEGEDAEESSLIVLDMKTGRVTFEQPRDGTDLGSWVVKRNGSAAWATSAYEGGEPGGAYKLDSTTGGKPQRIGGPEGSPHLVRLSTDRRNVLWSELDGVERSAPIE
jgi:hypothetical protein